MKSHLRFAIAIFLVAAFTFLSVQILSAQSPFDNSQLVTKLWEVINGHPDTLNFQTGLFDVDYASGFGTADSSSNLVVIGNTITTNGTTDILVTKYTESGAIDWQHTWNNTYDSLDYGTAVCTDDSDNIYVAGTSVTSANNFDYVILKYDSSGTLKWYTTYDGTASYIDVPTAMIYYQGYIYVTGTSSATGKMLDYCTMKIDRVTKHSQWVVNYDYSSKIDIPAVISIASDTSGTVLIVTGGSGTTLINWDFATVKYNLSGTQLGVKRNSSSGLGFDLPTAIAEDQFHNIYVTGRASVSPNGYDIKIVKLDSDLNTVWSVNKDGGVHLDDGANSIAVDWDGNVYVTGFAMKQNGGSDYITLKYSVTGNLIWEQRYSSPDTSKFAQARMLDRDTHGNILVTGSVYNIANKDILTLCYDTAGNKLWEEWHGTAKGDDISLFIKADLDNVFYVTGKEWIDTSYQYVTIKYKEIDFITPPDTEYCPNSFAYYENKGQIMGTDSILQDQIKYYTLHHYPDIYFANDTQSFVFSHIDTSSTTDDTLLRVDAYLKNNSGTNVYNAWNRVPGYLNYFKPWCSDGVTEVRGYQRLLYPEVYDKIDWMIYANGAGLKYYFIVKPGGDDKDIILSFYKPDAVNINYDGTLDVVTTLGTITFQAPTAYQIDTDGSIINFGYQPTYVANGSYDVIFNCPSYDPTKPFIIEMKRGDPGPGPGPSYHWSTWIGGINDEAANAIATDDLGNSYIGGYTQSNPFPNIIGPFQGQLIGVQDCFVERYDDGGHPIWGTYYGGLGEEEILGLTISASGDLYFVGKTTSPTLTNSINGLQGIQDGFIARMDLLGTNVSWASFIGGSADDDICRSVVTDNENAVQSVYVVGASSSTLPSFEQLMQYGSAYYQDYNSDVCEGFIIKYDNSNQPIWGSLFGGDSPADFCDVKIDPAHNVFVSGSSAYDDFQSYVDPVEYPAHDPQDGSYFQSAFAGGVYTPYHDAIIVEFNNVGELQWSTPFGGDGDESSVYPKKNSICIDLHNSRIIYLVGTVNDGSNNFPFAPCNDCFQQNFSEGAYIAKFNDRVEEWCTMIGCGDVTSAFSVTTDDKDNVYLCGLTECLPTTNTYFCLIPPNGEFPMCPGADCEFFQENDCYYSDPQFWGEADGIIVAFNSNNKLIWSTYYGGDHLDQLNAIAFDNYWKRIYVAGASNSIAGYPFPLYPPTAWFQTDNSGNGNGTYDATIARFDVYFVNTGIDQAELSSSSLQAFPNPTSDIINLDLSSIKRNIEQIEICNIFDQNLITIKNNAIGNISNFVLSLSHLSSGVYIIKVISKEAIYSAKIVKQ